MKVEEAIEIVLGLAKENVLRVSDCQDDQMDIDREKQIEACDTIEDFFVNVVFDGSEES